MNDMVIDEQIKYALADMSALKEIVTEIPQLQVILLCTKAAILSGDIKELNKMASACMAVGEEWAARQRA